MKFDLLLPNCGKSICVNYEIIGDMGSIIFPSSVELALYLDKINSEINFSGVSCLELGAGTGLTGIAFAALGGTCKITDLGIYSDNLIHNVELQEDQKLRERLTVASLDWNDHDEANRGFSKMDYIIISDCIYYEDSIGPLIETIRNYSDFETTIWLAYQRRKNKDKIKIYEDFFIKASEIFAIESLSEIQDKTDDGDMIYIYKMKLRKNFD